MRADPARQHEQRDDGRGGPDRRWAGRAGGVGRAHLRARPGGRRDRRRLHLGGRADPLGQGLRHRPGPFTPPGCSVRWHPGGDPEGPPMTLLCADIGNSHTVLGLLRDGDVLDHWRVATDERRTSDEWAVLIRGLLADSTVADGLTGISVCATVPAVLHEWRDMLRSHFGAVTNVVVEPGVRTGVPVLMDNPREVGADRIINALAAARMYDGPCIVVDFGTATTFDVVSPRGEYIGGAGAPGIHISPEALRRRGAPPRKGGLPRPRTVIAKKTREALPARRVFRFASPGGG